MKEFKSLKAKGLAKDFDAEIRGGQPLVDVKEAKEKIVVTFTFPGFFETEHVRSVAGKKIAFKEVNIDGTGFISESGKPLLPSFGRYIQIPPDCAYSISVTKSKSVTFEDTLIYPSQEQITDSPGRKDEFEYDRAFYKKAAAYPKSIVGTAGPFEIDEYPCILLNVCPFQYYPAKRKLVGYSKITVTIKLKPRKGRATDTLSSSGSRSSLRVSCSGRTACCTQCFTEWSAPAM